eukprot:CAMPEP_0117621936 /NCGR_PEP_ID=MMETSP0784-20121206/87887_1 /TAXON_ID=39447 /ORGANISM="" /LENGTH=692 /DNA_ID=CAMNT_0005425869 /DNA_START=58 /DNA_END=2139 /DNA_ORIENTATION=+
MGRPLRDIAARRARFLGGVGRERSPRGSSVSSHPAAARLFDAIARESRTLSADNAGHCRSAGDIPDDVKSVDAPALGRCHEVGAFADAVRVVGAARRGGRRVPGAALGTAGAVDAAYALRCHAAGALLEAAGALVAASRDRPGTVGSLPSFAGLLNTEGRCRALGSSPDATAGLRADVQAFRRRPCTPQAGAQPDGKRDAHEQMREKLAKRKQRVDASTSATSFGAVPKPDSAIATLMRAYESPAVASTCDCGVAPPGPASASFATDAPSLCQSEGHHAPRRLFAAAPDTDAAAFRCGLGAMAQSNLKESIVVLQGASVGAGPIHVGSVSMEPASRPYEACCANKSSPSLESTRTPYVADTKRTGIKTPSSRPYRACYANKSSPSLESTRTPYVADTKHTGIKTPSSRSQLVTLGRRRRVRDVVRAAPEASAASSGCCCLALPAPDILEGDKAGVGSLLPRPQPLGRDVTPRLEDFAEVAYLRTWSAVVSGMRLHTGSGLGDQCADLLQRVALKLDPRAENFRLHQDASVAAGLMHDVVEFLRLARRGGGPKGQERGFLCWLLLVVANGSRQNADGAVAFVGAGAVLEVCSVLALHSADAFVKRCCLVALWSLSASARHACVSAAVAGGVLRRVHSAMVEHDDELLQMLGHKILRQIAADMGAVAAPAAAAGVAPGAELFHMDEGSDTDDGI